MGRSGLREACYCEYLRIIFGTTLGGVSPLPIRHKEQISAIWRPLSRLLNFSSVIIGTWPFWAKSWPGGHGRSREVTVGYGRLRRRKTEESGGTAGKRFEKNERI